MAPAVGTEQARERINAALDAIDAAHDVLRDTCSDLLGNRFRVDIAQRLETQDRANRGLMYRFFAEIADPPDESGSVAAVRSALWARLRITPNEINRRCPRSCRRWRPRSRPARSAKTTSARYAAQWTCCLPSCRKPMCQSLSAS